MRAEAARLEPGAEAGERRRLAGRVLARRGHGKLTFLDLVDRSGRIQLLCDESRAGPVDVDLGDIVGASGSGKSTIIRLLIKELEPTRGRIIVGGRDLARLKRSRVPMLRPTPLRGCGNGWRTGRMAR